MNVVAKAIEELRAIRLGVDGLKLVALDKGVALGTFEHRVLIEATSALPDSGQRRKWTQIRQGVGIRLGLGVIVVIVSITQRVPPRNRCVVRSNRAKRTALVRRDHQLRARRRFAAVRRTRWLSREGCAERGGRRSAVSTALERSNSAFQPRKF